MVHACTMKFRAPQKVYLRNRVPQRAPKNHSPKLCFLYVKSLCFGTAVKDVEFRIDFRQVSSRSSLAR